MVIVAANPMAEGNWRSWAKAECRLAAGVEIAKVQFAVSSTGKLEGYLARYAAAKLEEYYRLAQEPE